VRRCLTHFEAVSVSFWVCFAAAALFRPRHESARRRYRARGQGFGVARSTTGPRSITSVKPNRKCHLEHTFQALTLTLQRLHVNIKSVC